MYKSPPSMSCRRITPLYLAVWMIEKAFIATLTGTTSLLLFKSYQSNVNFTSYMVNYTFYTYIKNKLVHISHTSALLIIIILSGLVSVVCLWYIFRNKLILYTRLQIFIIGCCPIFGCAISLILLILCIRFEIINSYIWIFWVTLPYTMNSDDRIKKYLNVKKIRLFDVISFVPSGLISLIGGLGMSIIVVYFIDGMKLQIYWNTPESDAE